ncbi:conserved hypothetical protein, partial [Perkinsus marinus ATCC 50983]
HAAAERYATYLSGEVYSTRLSIGTNKQWMQRTWSLFKQRRRAQQHHSQHWSATTPLAQWTAPYDMQAEGLQSQPFTPAELTRALKRLNYQTTCGPDQILPRFLQHGTAMLERCLLRLISKSFSSTQVPAAWRLARVVTIKKTTTSSTAATLKDFRPISITNIFGRIAEAMVVYRMECQLERDPTLTGCLDPHQHGFRPGRSLDEHVAYLHSSFQSHLSLGRMVAFISLDWTKAYDTVTLSILYNRLLATGIHLSLCSWIWAFLRGRLFYVEIDGKRSATRQQRQGLPQGCISSPLLWTIYLNPLIKQLSE